MQKILEHNVKIMGVINITPDSFSDGNQITNTDLLTKRIQNLQETYDVLDFGAESTAPKNSAVSAEVEWSRFEKLFLPVINSEFFKPHMILSLDTYRPEVFFKLLEKIRNAGIQNEIWWNDISGLLDDYAIDAMKQKNVKYIYCQNFAASRTVGAKHLDFIQSDDLFFEKFLADFERVYEQAQKQKFLDKIIFDPCFGFAKSRIQNLKLIDEWACVAEKFSTPWLIGLSKKSFLRPTSETPSDILENIHALALAKILKLSKPSNYIFRVHQPMIIDQVIQHLN